LIRITEQLTFERLFKILYILFESYFDFIQLIYQDFLIIKFIYTSIASCHFLKSIIKHKKNHKLKQNLKYEAFPQYRLCKTPI